MRFANELMARIYYVYMLLIYAGVREGSTLHLEILAHYNKITPLPRQHTANKSDSWCAIFLNGIGWLVGFRGWPWECSCTLIREEAKRRGIWKAGWTGKLQVGDWIVYNWDGKGGAEHIGAIVAIFGNSVWVAEGNYDDAVKIRRIKIGDTRVEGIVELDFTELVEAPTEAVTALRPGDSGERVYLLQVLLRGAGYYYGALTGEYDEKTTAAVMDFQRCNGLEVDGKAGPKTQAVIRSGKFEIFTEEDDTMEQQKRYQTVEELPDWAKDTIRKMVKLGYLKGDGQGLDLSLDMIRVFVANDRAHLYDGKVAQLS